MRKATDYLMQHSMRKKQAKHKKNEMLNWQTVADGELFTSAFFGAIIRYILYFGQRKFRTLYRPEEFTKNVLIGWLVKVVLLLIFMYVGYRLSTS